MRRLTVRHERQRDGEDHILPLINVVFLMLIFFMVAGHLTASDPFPIMPPRSAVDQHPDGDRILVQLGADGSIALDGQPVEADGLGDAIAAALAEHPNMPLTLKADGTAEAVKVVEIMEQLRAAGLQKLTLMTVAGGS